MNPAHRLRVHLSYAVLPQKRTKTYERIELIKRIKAAGLELKIKVLKVCSVYKAGKWEEFYYNKFKKQKRNLLQCHGKFYIATSIPSINRKRIAEQWSAVL